MTFLCHNELPIDNNRFMRNINPVHMLSKVKYVLIIAALAVTSACNEEDSPGEESLGGCYITLNGGPYNNSKYATPFVARKMAGLSRN